jgi:hypothetical protein
VGTYLGRTEPVVQPATTHTQKVVAGFAFVEGKRKGKDRVEEEGLIVGGAT